MARQECNNTFSDGLMMDLNPINTPKSVLTDCLNGTYITYNGNEFVLQNDMGNYKLKNCKLPTNFIPVGVKGYGDILYIVSYNPITNETEIGSYPAPQSIFTTGDSEDLLATEGDLAPFTWGPGTEIQETEVEYPDIIKTNKKPIFVFSGGTDEETYKLNPGDEFRFSGELTPPAFIYQHLNFYIIDEDNKLYDIDDTKIYNESGSLVSSDTMRKVFWETPGWLAAQYDLYVPDKFNLNLRSLNVPEFLVDQSNEASSQIEDESLDELQPDKGYFKVSMDLSSQTIITDKLFQTELNKHFGNELANTYDHLYIRYLIKRNIDPPNVGEDDYGTFKGIVVSLDDTHTQDYTNGVIEEDYVYYDIPIWKHNYQDDIITAYNNVKPIWFCKNPKTLEESGDLDIANYHGVVELIAYPIIKYNDLTLKYTQFSTTQRFPLNTLKNSSNITIADQIYKWSVDDDSCTISFNINGPFINASDITGRYEIYRINLFNRAGNKEDAKSQAAKGTNENPKSVSSYNVEEGLTGDFLVKENNKWIRKFDQPVSVNSFASEEKLLMCEGTLSNLVLYGQNTLNIDRNSSKEYKLTNYYNYYTNPDYDFTKGADNGDLEKAVEDTSYIDYESKTKTINFSKEGGIYIFRVILEQNESQLQTSEQILIPSKVFNSYFGSADNYLNDITSAMWVGQWMESVSQPLMINDLQVDFNTEETITKEKTWEEFILEYGLKKVPVELVYKLSESGTSTNEVDWKQTIVNGMKETSGNTYQWLSTPATFKYLINVSKLNPKITLRDGIISINKLEGNLWNPILTGNTVLKTNVNDEIINLNVDGSISFAKTIEIPWNLSNPNSTTTFAKSGDDVYLFDPPRDTSLDGNPSYPNIRLYGEQNGNGDRTNRCWVRVRYDVVWANGSGNILNTQQNTYRDNEYTSCDSTAFSLIGDSLSNTSSAWGKYSYDLGNRISDNSRAYLYRDSDDNPDKGQIGRQNTPYTGIQLFATGGNSNLKNKTVAIHLNNELDINKFVWGLMHIVAVNNSNTSSTVYYPTFGIDNIIENEIVTLTKYTTNLSLAYLRVDDLIINKNLSDLSDYSETLLSTPVINLNKIINNSMSNLIVNLNYSDNIKYNTFIQGITQGINDFNSSQQSNITIANSAIQGSYLTSVDDPAPNSSVLKSEFGSDFGNSIDAKAAADAIISKLAKRDIRYNYSASNIGYINESKNTLKYINARIGNKNIVDGSGSIMICYVEDFNF